jgi:hypothetical protein
VYSSDDSLHGRVRKDRMEQVKDHPYLRKERGAVVALNGSCVFLAPNDEYTDPRGRKYVVAPDGSMRRVKSESK